MKKSPSTDSEDSVIKSKFQELIEDSGMMQKKFLGAVNLDSKTWNKRLDDPSELTVRQIKGLADLLHTTPAKLLKVILDSSK